MKGQGKKIRAARERANLTRKELADRAGVSQATVKRLEVDASASHFKYETLAAVARALDLDFADVAVTREVTA